MIRNYLNSALRNFLRYKSFTFLNILGLSLGLAASILIVQYVKYERSFDQFHSNVDNIYRIQYNIIQNGVTTVECAAAVPAVGPAMVDNFPEITMFTRLFPLGGVMSYESKERGYVSFREEDMQFTDPRVFEVFDFRLVEGDEKSALEGPNKIVISERAAQRYFGDEKAIGKYIRWGGWGQQIDFEVTGVLENVPDNSHIKFDLLLSFETLNNLSDNNSETNWGWYDFNTYVTVEPGTDMAELKSKWDEWLYAKFGEEWEQYKYANEYIFQPVSDIHLYSNLLQESQPEEQGDGDSIYFLAIISIFILIIAWVNYMNLSTAKSFDRANEVGVRKVMGADKSQLIRQFLVESFLINLGATAIAIAIVAVSWPAFSSLSGRNIPFSYILDGSFWWMISGMIILGTFLAGFYPALVLSAFRPVSVLKGKIHRSSSGALIRKGLVIFQFMASVVLISGTVIVQKQLNFMKNTDLGVDINQTLVVRGPGITDSLYQENLRTFRNEALSIPGIKTITSSSNVPGNEIFLDKRGKKSGWRSGKQFYYLRDRSRL